MKTLLRVFIVVIIIIGGVLIIVVGKKPFQNLNVSYAGSIL